MAKRSTSEQVPKDMQARFDDITQLTDIFSQVYLNDEYATLCRQLTATLCRKRPSPLSQGKVATWACGIIQVNGFVMDARHAPREIQEEAFRKGLIPYIPGGGLSRRD